MGSNPYNFTKRLLKGDMKATFNQTALNIGTHTVKNYNKVLIEMTKHVFPSYASHKQQRYIYRFLMRSRSMKINTYVIRL